jgi:hypothetical protein
MGRCFPFQVTTGCLVVLLVVLLPAHGQTPAAANSSVAVNASAIAADGNDTAEALPTPEKQVGPEARNYVAYIPVPINDGEDEDEDADSNDDEEEEEDEESEDEEEEEEEDEEEDEDEDVAQESGGDRERKKPSSRRRKKPKSSKRRRVQSKNDKERVPFLVPLMMVPENQVIGITVWQGTCTIKKVSRNA